MDATPINFDSAVPLNAATTGGDDALSIARKWTALHDAAAIVATLAGVEARGSEPGPEAFAAAIGSVPPPRRERAEQAVDDLVAIMEPGLAALIAVNARGGDAAVPARALWEEFAAARDALRALVLPGD